jgi:hypothetical protein
MLFAFDVDCGQVVGGHRFIARGLADCGTIDLAWLGATRLGRSELASMIVPVPDDTMTFAIKAITDARDSAVRWQEEAEELLVRRCPARREPRARAPLQPVSPPPDYGCSAHGGN